MHDEHSCQKCFHISKAFFGKPWLKLIQECMSKPDVKAKWKKAEEKYELIIQIHPDIFGNLLFATSASTGMMRKSFISLESWFYFLRLVEFSNRFKHKPGALNLKIIRLADEQGRHDLEGVLVRPSVGEPFSVCYRLVRFTSEKAWYIDETYVDSRMRLSEEQPNDTYEVLGAMESKNLNQDR